MEFIKKNLKVIIGFIIGVILASSITVYATEYLYNAKDVKYADEKSVEDALNDLYIKANISSSNNAEVVLIEENISGLEKDKSIDIKSKYSNYRELTNDDFRLIITNNSYDTTYVAGDKHPSISYNSDTGIAVINGGVMSFSKGARVWNIVSLYIVK